MIKFRNVVEADLIQLFKWTQEPGVREFAFGNKEISLEEHTAWFNKKFIDPNCLMLIATKNGAPCGQIRFDRSEDICMISFSIALDFRGKGLASVVLKEGAEICFRHFGESVKIHGIVMEANSISVRAFKSAGYFELEKIYKDSIPCIRFALSRLE